MLRRLFETTPDNNDTANLPSFLTSPQGPTVAAIIESHSSKIHNDSLLKIVRQLDFWHSYHHEYDEWLEKVEIGMWALEWSSQLDFEVWVGAKLDLHLSTFCTKIV